MVCNHLRLTPSNSDFLWCTDLWHCHLLDDSAFAPKMQKFNQLTPSATVETTFTAVWPCRPVWVNLFKRCLNQLHFIRIICRLIPISVALTLVNSFIVFKVDYFSSILAGLLTCQLERVQLLLNSALCLAKCHLIMSLIYCMTSCNVVFLSRSPTNCCASSPAKHCMAWSEAMFPTSFEQQTTRTKR